MANYIWLRLCSIPTAVALRSGKRLLLDIWNKQISELSPEHQDELGKGIPCEVEAVMGNYAVLRVLDELRVSSALVDRT